MRVRAAKSAHTRGAWLLLALVVHIFHRHFVRRLSEYICYFTACVCDNKIVLKRIFIRLAQTLWLTSAYKC